VINPSHLLARKRALGLLLLAITSGILVAGLWPFNFSPRNEVEWLKNTGGARFYGLGLAYTEKPILSSPQTSIPTIQDSNIPLGLSIELWLQAGTESAPYTARILSLYDNQGIERVVLSQWKSGLILQKDIRGRHEERQPKLGIRNALPKGGKRFFTITSGAGGTCIYVGGKLLEKHPRFRLTSGKSLGPCQLILGNSPRGKQSWQGNLYSLAVYDVTLTEEQVFQHFQKWENQEGAFLSKERGLVALYLFDESSGPLAHDRAGNYNLLIPSRFEALQKTVLVPPWKDFELSRSYALDIITNILGFIPFGFFLAAYLRTRKTPMAARSSLVTILAAGITSLIIELLQIYLPMRSSQCADVICNTLGAALGSYMTRGLKPDD